MSTTGTNLTNLTNNRPNDAYAASVSHPERRSLSAPTLEDLHHARHQKAIVQRTTNTTNEH